MQKKRAYSLLTIKSVNAEERVIEGIATTPNPDRMGDIVDSEGAQYSLPIPLLWQHDSDQPVGHVEACKVTKDGIEITARMVTIDEPGCLKDRLDEAWQSIKSGLVRGLSIGFMPMESARIKDTWNEHFTKWDWLELSCVTIPANSEASIISIKSADEALRAASGTAQAPVVPLAAKISGVTEITKPQPKLIPKGTKMKTTVAEQIALNEAARANHSNRMGALMEGEVSAEARTEFDTLQQKCADIDADIVRLKALEAIYMTKATPVTVVAAAPVPAAEPRHGDSGIISVRQNLAEGQTMGRWAMAMVRSKGNLSEALAATQNNRAWMDTSPELATVLKAAVAAGDTTSAGWASDLVYANNLANEFINFLRPSTIIGKLTGLTNVPFNIRIAGQSAGSSGHWVGQGQPVAVSKLGTTSVIMGITKAAGLVAIDEELARSSSPSAELLVRNDLAAAIQQFLDRQFIDPAIAEVAGVSPASITYGVTGITPSGTDYVALRNDIQALMAPMIDANIDTANAIFVMSSSQATAISMMLNPLGQPVFPLMSVTGGKLAGLPVVVSQSAILAGSETAANSIFLISAPDVFLADDGQVTISLSTEASIQMMDNPTVESTGSTTPTSLVSMFQTSSMAIKAVRYINWMKRRPAAASWIGLAAYK